MKTGNVVIGNVGETVLKEEWERIWAFRARKYQLELNSTELNRTFRKHNGLATL